MRRRRLIYACAACLGFAVGIAIGAGIYSYWEQLHRASDNSAGVVIVIPPGASGAAVSRIIREAGIPHSRSVYRLEDFRRGDDYIPKAGEFALPPFASLADALAVIHKGEVIQHAFTIFEGMTTAEFLTALNADTRFAGEVSGAIAEGALLPETYFFTRDEKRDDFIARVTAAQSQVLAGLWAARQDDLPLKSPQEALVLASIIEKETARAEERRLVASVFVNRLRRGMRLQSDPTVLYGLARAGEARERLTRDDLKHPSPWNTYLHGGLPPSPICNPGLASIAAALAPADSDYFYFVADGAGGHAFAETLAEHNANVAAWRRRQKAQDAAGQ